MNDLSAHSSFRIAPDFSYLETAQNERVAFTRFERLALRLLASRPHRLFTRGDILDAISEQGSDKSDRNIDFLINRLRKKLQDNASNPRFIATRYGEGYVWIADAPFGEPDVADADFVIGPVTGLDALPEGHDEGERFAQTLVRVLKTLTGEKKIVYAPQCPPGKSFGIHAPDRHAELSFFSDRGKINCVITVREFRSGRPIAAKRILLSQVRTDGTLTENIAQFLEREIWRDRAAQISRGTPLPVALFATSRGDEMAHNGMRETNDPDLHSLSEDASALTYQVAHSNEKKLRSMLTENPQDAELKLLLAVAIHSKYILTGDRLFAQGTDNRANDEDEMEALVTEALPHIRQRPEYSIVAGKLLYFLQRGYDELGRELCEDAYDDSISVVDSLAIIGQMRAFFGETDFALESIDQALRLARPGSHAHAYALVLKAQALSAAARWDELALVKSEMGRINVILRLVFEPFLCHPARPSNRAKATMLFLSRRRTEGLLMHRHYVSARLFRNPLEGANTLRSFARLAARRHGPDVIPMEVIDGLPGLLDGPV